MSKPLMKVGEIWKTYWWKKVLILEAGKTYPEGIRYLVKVLVGCDPRDDIRTIRNEAFSENPEYNKRCWGGVLSHKIGRFYV